MDSKFASNLLQEKNGDMKCDQKLTAINLVTKGRHGRNLDDEIKTRFYSILERIVSSGSVFGLTECSEAVARRRKARQSVRLSSRKFSGKVALFICSTQPLIPI